MIKNILHQIRTISIVVMTFAILVGLGSSTYAEYACGTYGADEFGNDCPVDTTASPTGTKPSSSTINNTTNPDVAAPPDTNGPLTPNKTNDNTTKDISSDQPTSTPNTMTTQIWPIIAVLGVIAIMGSVAYLVVRHKK